MSGISGRLRRKIYKFLLERNIRENALGNPDRPIIYSHSSVMAAGSDRSQNNKSKLKMNFKAHLAEGYMAKYRGELVIKLDPRITMATDDKGKPLKCSAFLFSDSASVKKGPLSFIRLAEKIARWIDISRKNPLVRLEGVDRKPGTYKNYCIAESLTPINEQGQKIAMPVPKYEFTMQEVNKDGTLTEANQSYRTCLNIGTLKFLPDTKEMSDVSLMDYCSCFAIHISDFPVEKYKHLSANQLRTQRLGQSTASCMSPKAYQ